MKNQFKMAVVLAVALEGLALFEASGGVIMIATRKNQDTAYSTEHSSEEKGPGLVTVGDVAMAALLGDNGYSCRLLLDALLNANLGGNPGLYLTPTDENMKIDMVIWSGSSSSADVPAPPEGVPLMMGEHVTLGNRTDRLGSIFMYNGQNSSDPNESSTPVAASKYMKVVAPNHPIMQGIPVDAQGRVKIFREPYPGEESHVPTGGKRNFEYRWCTQVVADAAPGTTVLGVLDGAEDRACFAVAEKGGVLANGLAAGARMVHLFTNENGSGGSRRVFLALTPWGRLLFVRAAQWALGEELKPYEPLRILDVTAPAPGQVVLSWQGSTNLNYRIEASADAATWQLVGEDIAGVAGLVRRTLDVSAAPQTVFFRVGSLP
jgi:hypothetical protein